MAVAGDHWLENDLVRVEIDPASGALRLVDRAAGFDVLKAGALPAALPDRSDTWSHGLVTFDTPGETFMLERVHLLERGAARASLRAVYRHGQSMLVQVVTLTPGSREVHVQVTADWREQHALLRFRFPLNLAFTTATYDIPYGHITRPANGEEEPGGRWVDVTGIRMADGAVYGLSLLNDGKYSFAVSGDTLAMTALRSPIYAHHDPLLPDADRDYSYLDQGRQRFSYSLVAHDGPWQDAGIARAAALLNQPPEVMLATFHAGELPPVASYLHIDTDNVDVGAVKLWEEGDDLIVRLAERARRATRATLTLPQWGNRSVALAFRPCEIKTIRIPRDPAAPPAETDFLE
jgi:alpha-mannosidase